MTKLVRSDCINDLVPLAPVNGYAGDKVRKDQYVCIMYVIV